MNFKSEKYELERLKRSENAKVVSIYDLDLINEKRAIIKGIVDSAVSYKNKKSFIELSKLPDREKVAKRCVFSIVGICDRNREMLISQITAYLTDLSTDIYFADYKKILGYLQTKSEEPIIKALMKKYT